MHDDNLHIVPDPQKGYPEPGVPVDDAWSQMQSVLDAEMPRPSSPKGGNIKGGGSHFLNTALVVMGVVGALVWSVLHFTKSPDTAKKDKTEIVSGENGKSENTKTSAKSSEKAVSTPGININPDTALNEKHSLPGETALASNSQPAKPTGTQKERSTSETKTSDFSKPVSGNSATLSNKDKTTEINMQLVGNASIKKEESGLPNQAKVSESEPKNIPVIGSLGNEASIAVVSKVEESEYQADVRDEANVSAAKVIDTTLFKQSNANLITQDQPQINVNSGDNKHDSTQSAPVLKPSMEDISRDAKTGTNDFFKTNHFGLQWKTDIPFSGTNYYFTGYDGKKKPYMTLVPGAWFSHNSGRNEILLTVDPINQNFTGKILLSTLTISDSLSHDSTSVMQNKTTYLHKTYGYRIGIQYNFEIVPSFIVGLGINYNAQIKALQSVQVTNQETGALISDSLYGIKKSSNEWDYLKSGFFAVKAEAAWRRKLFDVGASVTFPITNLSSLNSLTIQPINGQVFFRWKIK